MEYKTLEPSPIPNLAVPTLDGTPSLLATSTFLYTLFFLLIVGGAFYRYGVAGVLRMQASENSIRQSNEIIKKVTLGLLGVFSLFLILFTVNKGLVTGDVGLEGLKGGRVEENRNSPLVASPPSPIAGAPSGSGSSRLCEPASTVISKLTSSSGVCGGVSCTALSGCNYQQYLPLIEQAVGGDATLKKMAIVIMCRESKARASAENRNPDGTYDCGLMQINQNGPCSGSSLSPEQNITEGVRRLKQKITSSSQVYLGVPVEAGIFSSYNCCSNGTNPVAPSVDCTASTGFPSSVPKWVCPINPGEGLYNMCSVKNYACDLTACLKSL